MKTLIDDFTAHVGKSDAYTTMTNHIYQVVNGVKEYASKDVRFGGSISVPRNDTKYYTNGNLDFLSIFTDVIASGKLPNDPVHGLYGLVFEGDLNFDAPIGGLWAGSPKGGGTWCGIHGYLPVDTLGGTQYHLYAVGDPITTNDPLASGCTRRQFNGGSSPNNNLQADNLVKVIYHELAEEVSNYDEAWRWTTPGSFLSGSIVENADLCNEAFYPYLKDSTTANTIVGSRTWLLQNNWMPGIGCAMKSPYNGWY